MYSSHEWLPTRNPQDIAMVGTKMLIRLEVEEWKSKIIKPDTVRKGDTTRRSNVGFVVSVAPGIARGWSKDTRVVVHPSIDPGNWSRGFEWQGERFFICDERDIELVA